jgi:hypothetical protein
VSIKPGRVSSRARVSAARLSRTAVASSWGVRAERALSVTRPVVIDLAIQKYDIHGTMHLHVAIVFNEAQFPKLVHEAVDSRASSADHLGNRCLADFRYHRLRPALLAKICHDEQQSRQAFLARIEKLIDQVLFNTGIPSQRIRHESLRKFGSSWSTRSMVVLSNRIMMLSVMGATAAKRRG